MTDAGGAPGWRVNLRLRAPRTMRALNESVQGGAMTRRVRRSLRRLHRRTKRLVLYVSLLVVSLTVFLATLHSCSVPPDAEDKEPIRVELRTE